jgi:hypothetical protein
VAAISVQLTRHRIALLCHTLGFRVECGVIFAAIVGRIPLLILSAVGFLPLAEIIRKSDLIIYFHVSLHKVPDVNC